MSETDLCKECRNVYFNFSASNEYHELIYNINIDVFNINQEHLGNFKYKCIVTYDGSMRLIISIYKEIPNQDAENYVISNNIIFDSKTIKCIEEDLYCEHKKLFLTKEQCADLNYLVYKMDNIHNLDNVHKISYRYLRELDFSVNKIRRISDIQNII